MGAGLGALGDSRQGAGKGQNDFQFGASAGGLRLPQDCRWALGKIRRGNDDFYVGKGERREIKYY